MEQELLKSGYRRYSQEDESILFQKKVTDFNGIKYFINCYMYEFKNRKTFNFDIQISVEYGTINTSLFNTKLSIKKIERFMEDLWLYYGKNYYELFTKEGKGDIQ